LVFGEILIISFIRGWGIKMMKDFTWSAFEKTGSIDAYMLYKESLGINEAQHGMGQNKRYRIKTSQNR
jgi:hypothetical protein